MSALAMHAICHRQDGRPVNLRNINPKEGVYGSGWWTVDAHEAASLVGGWLYLHETSGAKSHFVGKIESVNDPDPEGRYEFVVRKQRLSEQPWRGGRPGQHPKHYVKIVPADYAHERDGAR